MLKVPTKILFSLHFFIRKARKSMQQVTLHSKLLIINILQLTLFISILSLFIPIFVSAGDGAFHVRGKLLCNGKPYENAEIELYEKNIS